MTLFAASCANQAVSVQKPDYWPTHEWRYATPEARGVDPGGIADMFEAITRGGYLIDGVVIAKDGYIIAEAYRQPFSEGRRHIIHSCTKSVVSACVGIAIEEGYLTGTDQRLTELFPNADSSTWSRAKQEITLEHMLTMSTGLDTQDSYLYRWRGLTAMRRSSDWVSHALSLPSVTDPGNRFDYSNITSFLLSAAIHENTGLSAEEFAGRHLFAPLGISDIRWPSSPAGVSTGWGELRLLPTDLAKFGMLYLQGGRWEDQQVVPEWWIHESWKPRMEAATLQPDYGYQWWIEDDEAFALGYAGQYLIVYPEQELVVVFVSNLQDDEFYVPEDLYYRHIRPAVERGTARTAPGSPTRLRDAIAAYSAPTGPEQRDSVPAGPPPAGFRQWSGTYELEENIFGLTGISFDFGSRESTAYSITEHYETGDDRYDVGAPDRFEVTTIDGSDIGLRGGWFPDGDIQLLFVGIGQAWWTRLRVEFGEDGVEISAITSSGRTTSFSGSGAGGSL